MTNGIHSHYCPECKTEKDCALITHCRRGAMAQCADHAFVAWHDKQHGPDVTCSNCVVVASVSQPEEGEK